MMSVATDLDNIASAVSAANAAAAAQTTKVAAAAADQVSTAVAALFGRYALDYQGFSAQAEAFHQRFVQALKASAASYAGAEAANVVPLQSLLTLPLGLPIPSLASLQSLLSLPNLATLQGLSPVQDLLGPDQRAHHDVPGPPADR
ncbi:hypothetical protein A4G29_15175 [Mycobacterium kansasii]|nr:hypothetical protein A4G29_15175 [Mycobacterium kansasii]